MTERCLDKIFNDFMAISQDSAARANLTSDENQIINTQTWSPAKDGCGEDLIF